MIDFIGVADGTRTHDDRNHNPNRRYGGIRGSSVLLGTERKKWSLIEKAFFCSVPMILAACGGGGGGQTAPTPTKPMAVYPVPVLRPCETTGPSAPTCSASQAAGTH